MAKDTVYVCTKCGAESPAWQGKCSVCGEWNSIIATAGKETGEQTEQDIAVAPQNLKNVGSLAQARIPTGFLEFDRVLGGGIVQGSLLLLGGEPGIGKSTLILSAVSNVSKKHKVLYISGEESAGQVKLRAERIGLDLARLDFLSERKVGSIVATLQKEKPELVIIDSIQTIYTSQLNAEIGGVAQVRFCSQKLLALAKEENIPIFLIGHVTKSGNVAGPKTLEHLVDVVLYLEGERYQSYRILRGIKNRFGATDETGVFAMTDRGLVEVKNPSEVFLEERKANLPGCCITVTLEGVRPFLIEIQALSSPTVFGYPRRTATGISLNRLHLIIAILTKRAKLRLTNQDIYVSIAGGFKVYEPAIDLAIALAIYSSFADKPLDPKLIALGEIGLAGELRRVSNIEKRVREAFNLGFEKIILPASVKIKKRRKGILPVPTLSEALRIVDSTKKKS